MHKYIYIVLFFVLVLVYCTPHNKRYVIEGVLDSARYDGEYMYLVPVKNATSETVDSAIIKDGQFTFKGYVDEPEVCILRTRVRLRLQLQELIVVKEPGNIEVQIAASSSASGTISNDSLQVWKEYKIGFDRLFRELMIEYRACSDSVRKPQLKYKLDSVKIESESYYRAFVENNINNQAGKFVRQMLHNN